MRNHAAGYLERQSQTMIQCAVFIVFGIECILKKVCIGMKTRLIIHGGAGSWPDQEDEGKRDSLIEASSAGWQILTSGGSALDAIEKAVNILEDEPLFDAGRGSHLNSEGVAQMDAIIVDAPTRNFGAIAGVERIRYPISLARKVMEETSHNFIIGAGAEQLAAELGIPLLPNSWFVTDAEWQRFREKAGAGTSDTVGAVAIDSEGRIAVATSTGGTFFKHPGRVGDAPLYGSGAYGDPYGGVSATGVGEHSMRVLLSKYVVDQIYAGNNGQEAANLSMQYIDTVFEQSNVGVIVIDRDGILGAAHTTEKLACGWIDENGQPQATMKGGLHALR